LLTACEQDQDGTRFHPDTAYEKDQDGTKFHPDKACEQDQDGTMLHPGTMFHPDPARKLSANLYDIYHCCVYSEKLLMIDRGTVRNM
jgi:hypothetical protein